MQHDTYIYNAQGNVIEQKNYTYKEDGTLKQGIEYVYDDEGEELSYFRYAAGGSFQGYEKIVDGNGDLIQQRTYGIDGNYSVRDYIPGTLAPVTQSTALKAYCFPLANTPMKMENCDTVLHTGKMGVWWRVSTTTPEDI